MILKLAMAIPGESPTLADYFLEKQAAGRLLSPKHVRFARNTFRNVAKKGAAVLPPKKKLSALERIKKFWALENRNIDPKTLNRVKQFTGNV